jgi:hypothetical protein
LILEFIFLFIFFVVALFHFIILVQLFLGELLRWRIASSTRNIRLIIFIILLLVIVRFLLLFSFDTLVLALVVLVSLLLLAAD